MPILQGAVRAKRDGCQSGQHSRPGHGVATRVSWTGMKNATSLTVMWRFGDKGHGIPIALQIHVLLLVVVFLTEE